MLTPLTELRTRLPGNCSCIFLGPLCWEERRSGVSRAGERMGTLPDRGGLLCRSP